jgi:hypothetical protein
MPTEDLEIILMAWRNSHGGQIPKTDTERQLAFLQLFANLNANGLSRQEVVSLVKCKAVLIESYCYNPNHRPISKLQIWKQLVHKNLIQALTVYNPPKEGVVTEQQIKALQELPAIKPSIKSDINEEYVQKGKELDKSIFSNIPEPPPIDADAFLQELEGEDE